MSHRKVLPGFGLFITGMRNAMGRKSTMRRSRHRQSQMKAIGNGRFSGKSSRFGL